MSLLDRQLQLETTYSKQNIKEWVQVELLESITTDRLFKASVALISAHLDTRASFYASKRLRYMKLSSFDVEEIALHIFSSILSITSTTAPVQAIATQIGLNFHDDQLSAVKTGAELLGVLEDIGLYDVTAGYKEDEEFISSFVTPNYQLSQETLDKIHTTMYLPPMSTAPLHWSDNNTGGYYVHSSSCVLGSGNNHDEVQSLDVLNTLQDIPWKFTDIINDIEPYAKPKKLSETDSEYQRRVKQHSARIEHSSHIYNMIDDLDKFYFVWKYDKRGRSYSQGYDVNLQGSEYKKASIEMATEELITGV